MEQKHQLRTIESDVNENSTETVVYVALLVR